MPKKFPIPVYDTWKRSRCFRTRTRLSLQIFFPDPYRKNSRFFPYPYSSATPVSPHTYTQLVSRYTFGEVILPCRAYIAQLQMFQNRHYNEFGYTSIFSKFHWNPDLSILFRWIFTSILHKVVFVVGRFMLDTAELVNPSKRQAEVQMTTIITEQRLHTCHWGYQKFKIGWL